MKTIAALTLLWLSAYAWAGADPKPADYNINIHVSSSSLVTGVVPGLWQKLSVVIDGRKYDLESDTAVGMLLALGDYKAKLVKDEHKTQYEMYQTYEFLFPDKKVGKFSVVGQTE